MAREQTRDRLVEVASELLHTGGPEAVTTRSVAEAAGVQAPTLYRLFGDKSGLLRAVAEHGIEAYVDGKRIDLAADPVEELRASWEVHVDFGLTHPALFRLLHSTPDTPAAHRGVEILRARVHRVAEAGRLRVSERRAVELVGAAGTGVVLTLLEQPAEARDPGLPDAAWGSLADTILTERPAAAPGPAAAAATLRAALPDLAVLSPAERTLLGEWLDRIADAPSA